MKEKTHILCIETSGLNCSVAISENENVLIEESQNTGSFSHAESLHLFIQRVLQNSGLSPKHIKAVSVSQGPGSYTGLRIGVSAAKGLCFAWSIPLIAVSTLQILARQASVTEGYIIPMLDARRMEVYSTVLDFNYQELEAAQPVILSENSYLEYLKKGKVTFLGDGSPKFAEIISHPNAFFIESAFPEARDMIKISNKKFLAADFADVAYFEPDYLKPFKVGK